MSSICHFRTNRRFTYNACLNPFNIKSYIFFNHFGYKEHSMGFNEAQSRFYLNNKKKNTSVKLKLTFHFLFQKINKCGRQKISTLESSSIFHFSFFSTSNRQHTIITQKQKPKLEDCEIKNLF